MRTGRKVEEVKGPQMNRINTVLHQVRFCVCRICQRAKSCSSRTHMGEIHTSCFNSSYRFSPIIFLKVPLLDACVTLYSKIPKLFVSLAYKTGSGLCFFCSGLSVEVKNFSLQSGSVFKHLSIFPFNTPKWVFVGLALNKDIL